MKTPVTLMKEFPHAGRVTWLSRRPARRKPLLVTESLALEAGTGINGDHYQGHSGKREVTLFQSEHLPVVASLCDLKELSPERLRRNILVAGINLLACRNRRIAVGDAAILEITGICAPCSRMETELGRGGYNAMRGHGGVTARVIRGGLIVRGDRICVIDELEPASFPD